MQGSGLYDTAINKLTGSRLNEGEVHAVLYTKDGFRGSSFTGPHTRVIENLKNDKKPISEVDRISKYHDIRYMLSETPEDIREADKHMIRRLKKSYDDGSDYRYNIAMGYIPIKAKMKAEDLGLMPKGSFGNLSSKTTLSPEDRELLNRELDKGKKLGYGKSSKPKREKENKWMKHCKSVQAKHPEMAWRDILKLAKKSYKNIS